MQDLKYNEQKSLKQNIKAFLPWLNFNTREMTEGRVKTAQNDILTAQADFVEAVVDEYNAITEV